MNSGDEQDPGEKIPTGREQADARPGVGTFVGAALWIDGHHPLHRFFLIDLREPLQSGRVAQVEEFDTTTRIEAAHTCRACAA